MLSIRNLEYEYEGYGRRKGTCKLTVNVNVIMATELPRSESTSITNVAETLATSAAKDLSIGLNNVIWIEHYEEHDSYDLVDFSSYKDSLVGPVWRHIEKEQAIELLKTGDVLSIWPEYFTKR